MATVQRLLVLAGAAAATIQEVPSTVRALLDEAQDVLVVTPKLPSRLEWLVSDIDTARQQADARLDTILGQLSELDISAAGAVGDETPITAIEDHIRAYHPDHLLVALRSREHAGWQERGLIERIQQEFHLPVTVFEIDSDGQAVTRE
jgi:hypothetical protein